ncbi:MAG: hypothetical protein EOM44_01905 [Bacteroidia bacterium]|nr:hypothetical protein [Bacteroidia bacterium]
MILIWLKCTRLKKKALKRAVRRNIKRIAADFMFELTSIELENLRYQNFTSGWGVISRLLLENKALPCFQAF